MRRSDHPSRPSANTCCCLWSSKTFVMTAKEHRFPAGVNVSAATRCGGRFSGVHQWPVLGVHRGASPTDDSADAENGRSCRPRRPCVKIVSVIRFCPAACTSRAFFFLPIDPRLRVELDFLLLVLLAGPLVQDVVPQIRMASMTRCSATAAFSTSPPAFSMMLSIVSIFARSSGYIFSLASKLWGREQTSRCLKTAVPWVPPPVQASDPCLFIGFGPICTAPPRQSVRNAPQPPKTDSHF